MRGKTVFAIFFATFPLLINATENTRRGKISFTEGHISPNCRTVELIENSSGNKKDLE